MSYYTIQEAATLVGVTYNQLWYAVITHRITESQRIGRLRLFDDHDIAVIREYFTGRKRAEKPT